MSHKLLSRNSIILVSVFALLALLTIANVSYASNNISTIVLSESLSPSQLKATQKKHNLKIDELHFTQGEVQGGYTFQPGESIDAAIDNFIKLHKEFLQISLNEATTKSKSSDKEESLRFADLQTQLETAEQMTQEGNIMIDELTTVDNESM